MEKQPGIAVMAMVKDESDIIEEFVRRNLRYAERIYVIDNGSEDGTLAILASLVQEGLALSVFQNDSAHFQQRSALNWLMRQVIAAQDFRYVVPLDADEFITESAEELLALFDQVPADCVPYLPWRNFFPLVAEGSGLARRFAHAPSHSPEIHKVVIPGRLKLSGDISEGNHLVTVDGQVVPGVVLPVTIRHVPVRSAEQIVAKALVGSLRLAVKPGRGPGEGYHWDQIAAYVRARHYQLNLQDLQCIAYDYPRITAGEALPFGAALELFDSEDVERRYDALAAGGAVGRLDSYLQKLTRQYLEDKTHQKP